jgi:hypothetical protein
MKPNDLRQPDDSNDDERAFEAAFGEELRAILALESWRTGDDLPTTYERIASEIAAAVALEARVRDPIRVRLFPGVEARAAAPPGAGVYRAKLEELKLVHHGLLFTGAVEACDATSYTHDTLPLSVTQIGVSLVTYNGAQGTWVHRLFRRDLRESLGDPAEEALALLERRSWADQDEARRRADLNDWARRAIRAYAERAILLRRSAATWRVGRGSPAPAELLTGAAGTLDIMVEGTRLLEELICSHQTFLFVPHGIGNRLLGMIGAALHPLEYAIVGTLAEMIEPIIEASHYTLPTSSDTTVDGRRLRPAEWIRRFCDEVASQVVVGVYRASELATARVFYAHVDHAHQAALIALADSVLQPHRGAPMLLDLAGQMCESAFGAESLAAALQLGYSRAGEPLQYFAGRMSGGRR